MKTYLIQESRNGVLLPLEAVIERFQVINLGLLIFQNVEMHSGRPFGLTMADFEQKTLLPEGYAVEAATFGSKLGSDFQMTEGTVCVKGKRGETLFTLECLDATAWEIKTESSEVESIIQSQK